MSTPTVAAEVAEVEFDRWVTAMRLSFDTSDMDADDKKSFTATRSKLVRAIMNGQLVVDESGQFVFTPLGMDPVVFHKPKGSIFMSTDRIGKDRDGEKTAALLGDMTKLPREVFSKMDAVDAVICQKIAMLFLV